MFLPDFPSIQKQLKAKADQLVQQGIKQYHSGQFREALQSLQQTPTIYKALGDPFEEAAALGSLGIIYYSLGQYQLAIGLYQQTLTISREIGYRLGEANSLGNLGNVYYHLGQYLLAINYHKQCLEMTRNIGDRLGEANSLGNLGNAYHSLGKYQLAIEYHHQWRVISQKIGDQLGEANALGNLGSAYSSLGQYEQAVKYQQKSLVIARQIGDCRGEAASLGSLGNVYGFLGQYEQAIEHSQQCLGIMREIGDRNGEATALGSLGSNYTDIGQYEQAISHFQQQLSITREIGERLGEANALGNLGSACGFLGQYQKAIEYFQQQLFITREIGTPRGEGLGLNNLGNALLRSGQLSKSENTLRTGIEVWEFLRTGLQDAHKVSIFEVQAITYRLLQEVLVAQNKTKDALAIAERGRGRAFVELLAERLSSPATTQLTSSPPSLHKIQQIAQVQNSILVEYSIIASSNLLLIWVIKPTGKITFRQVNLKPLQQRHNISLSDLVACARKSLGVEEKQRGATSTASLKIPQPIRYIAQPLRQLHQLLIEPIADLLPTDTNATIIFIPQGTLFLVPFPALQDATGKFLIEQHTILTAPSIQVLELTRKQRERVRENSRERVRENSLNALVVGNPTMPTIPLTEPPETLHPLPGAEAEANAIASLLSTQAIIGDKATKIDIVQQMPKARLIHLATHGLLDDIKQLGVPGAIALAPSDNDNGFLTAGEILEMKLNAELIVLSACSSGQGKITGDGVIGLSRSLFAAGIPSVIVSLWSVGDKSTQFLMTEFYQNLQHGMNKAQCLRQAMLTTMQRYRRPKSWAAFTLIGEAI